MALRFTINDGAEYIDNPVLAIRWCIDREIAQAMERHRPPAAKRGTFWYLLIVVRDAKGEERFIEPFNNGLAYIPMRTSGQIIIAVHPIWGKYKELHNRFLKRDVYNGWSTTVWEERDDGGTINQLVVTTFGYELAGIARAEIDMPTELFANPPSWIK